MRGKLIILFFAFVLSLNFAIAAESSILSDFNILGCRTNSEYLPYNSCSRYGLFWCNSKGKLLDVFRVKDTCLGIDGQANTWDDCCPANYFCTNGLCELREYDCSKFTEQAPCEDNGCIWFERPSGYVCIDRSQLIGCSDYIRNSTCIRDLFGLGKTNGLGTHICKGMYSGTNLVIINSCRCKWEGTNETNGTCLLTYDITDELDQDKLFTCDKNFNLSSCINIYQNISWIVSPMSYGLELNNQDLIRFDCINNSRLIRCDQTSVKLPFFGLMNFIICSFLIFMVYFYLVRKKKSS